MTAYAVQSPPHAGAQLTYSTPANGDTMPTGAGVALLVKNPAAGTAITVAATLPSVDGLPGPTRTVNIPVGPADWLIPFPASVYGPGPVTLTYTGTLTSVQVAAVVVPGS